MTTPSPVSAAHSGEASPSTRRLLLPFALAAAIVVVFLARGGVWDHVGGRDTHAMFVARYEAAGRALHELRLPLWNPYEFFGTPLLGSGQGASLYPPVAVLFALLPPRWALQALYAAHLALYAVALARYAMRHGVAPLPALLAPLLGLAGLFTGLGYNGIDHPSFVCELAWLPVALLGLDAALSRSWLVGTAILAIASGAQWLAGYPDFALDTAVLIAVAAVVHPDGTPLRRLAAAAAGLGLGAALGAPQTLAVREAVAESIRPEHLHNYAPFRENALRVRALADLERGPLKLAFAAALPLALLALGRDSRTRLLWLLALLWCAFPLNPPFSLLYALPGFAESRVPLGWGHMGGTFLGLLVAAGASDARDRLRGVPRAAAAALAIALAAQASFLVARAPTLLRGRAPDAVLLAERAAVLQEATRAVDDGSSPRLVAAPEVDGGALLRHELRSATGYEPAMPPRRAVHLLKALELHESPGWGTWGGVARDPELAALAGIGLVAARPAGVPALAAAGFRELRPLPGGDVLLYRPPVARARLVHRAEVVADELESLRRVLRSPGDARQRVVLEAADIAGARDARQLAALPATVDESARGDADESARIAVDEPERVAVDVEAAGPGLLVLTDAWAPGWQASVDGEPAALWRGDHAFRAVPVAAGRHRVEMRYRPAWLVPGFAVAAAAVIAVTAMLFAGRSARPRDEA